MPIAAAAPFITAGIGLYGASKQASAAKSAANANVQGQMAAIAEQQRQYNQSRSDEMPYMQSGVQNLGIMNSLNGGDFSKFYQSPDYQWTFNQGVHAQDASAAARGRLDSGGYGEDLTRFGQGLASQQYNSFYNKIAGLANQGQSAAAGVGYLGSNKANQIGNAYGNIGAANAQGIIGSANAWNNGLGSIAGMLTSSSYGRGGGGGAFAANGYGNGNSSNYSNSGEDGLSFSPWG